MNLRSFTDDVERVAMSWRAQVVSGLAWTVGDDVGDGRDGAYWVTSDHLSGIAKPKLDDQTAKAANEKIASDLAFDLGLPVPPVVLWLRPTSPRKHVCTSVSLLAFPGPSQWASLPGGLRKAASVLEPLAPVATAMQVFDAFVGNPDRINDGNLVLRQDSAANGVITRVAYIDYANALAAAWKELEWKEAYQHGLFPSEAKDVPEAREEAIKRILALSDVTLDEIVNRVPPDFLSTPQKATILRGLQHRRDAIKELLTASPSLP